MFLSLRAIGNCLAFASANVVWHIFKLANYSWVYQESNLKALPANSHPMIFS